MTSAAFNRQRRMFAIIDMGIYFAPENDRRSHIEWFVEQGWVKDYSGDPKFEKIIRGFIDPRGVFAYRGRDMTHFGVHGMLFPFLQTIQQDFKLPDDTKVWIGARPNGDDGLDGSILAGYVGELVERHLARANDKGEIVGANSNP